MKTVIQRVKKASVSIYKNRELTQKKSIEQGLLVLVGISPEDSDKDINWISKKIISMRIFEDENDKMNRSVLDIGGEILVVSQFTLYADCKKGNRPSFNGAAAPSISIPIYNSFLTSISKLIQSEVQTGEFGADMKVELINDGPVTIVLDSKEN